MTITDSIDSPTRTLAEISAHLAATGRLYTTDLIARMRSAGRDELVHYAGAAHRDPIAWQVAVAWLADPTAPESVLKSRALAIAAPAWSLTPEEIRAANPGMR